MKDRQISFVFGWDEHAALGHEAQQSQGFEGGRFASSIGTSHDQTCFSHGKKQVNWGDRLASGKQQGMPSLTQSDGSSAKARFCTAVFLRELYFRVQDIDR